MLQWNRRLAALMLVVAFVAALSGFLGGDWDLARNLHW
jgi:hypothetical protein